MTKRKPVFYTAKKTPKVQPIWAVKSKPPAEKAEMGLIQGRAPGSTLEWNVSQALDTLGLRYIYQYSIAGGRTRAGGQVLDFLVYTPIKPTPILVHGRYWHTGVHADELDTMKIKKLTNNRFQNVLVIWEENCQTIEQATTFLRQKLNIG